MAPTTSLFGFLLFLFILTVLVVYFLPLAFTEFRRFFAIWIVIGVAIAFFNWSYLTPPSVWADGTYDAGDSRVRNFLIIQWLFAAFAQLADTFAKRNGIHRRLIIVISGWAASLAVTLGMVWLVNLYSI
ncbi:hypothetical protein [Pelagibius sp. Alg239-R121]|uniref:hypothetical protein n=1 Tax=Pelagibius sp. Alg239-R121 TaxID=2993448 RepID=UPI0024A7706E|nr:hypothetical protein [Pelagibius sp. Alg239-R121]